MLELSGSLFAFGMNIAVVASTAFIAVLLLVSDHRRNWNQIVALFLVLISLNFLVGVWNEGRGLFDTAFFTDGSRVLWGRIGALTFIMDPAVIAYFASVFPRRTAFARKWYGPAFLGAVTIAFLVLEFQTSFLSSYWGRRIQDVGVLPPLFFLWVAAMYLFSVVRIVMNTVLEPSGVMNRQLRFIAIGMIVAFLPRIGVMPMEFWPSENIRTFLVHVLSFLLVTWGAFLALYLWARRTGRRRDRSLFRFSGLILALFSLYTLAHAATDHHFVGAWSTGEGPLWYHILHNRSMVYSSRWLIFALIVFYGIIRFQSLAVRPEALRTAFLVLALLLVVPLGGLLASQFGQFLGGTAAAVLSAGGAVLVYHQVTKARLRPIPSYLRQRALDAYRSNLAAALADGVVTKDEEETLQRARKRLGIGRREHELLMSIAEAEERPPEQRPLLLGRFEQIRRLGAGGYATVFLARDPEQDALVAVKQYHLGDGHRESHESAHRELKVAQRVSHPNLVAIHDILQSPDGMVVVMQFAEGGSLRDYLMQVQVLSPAEIQRLLIQVLDGLEALHQAGLVHGDLKPENILLDAAGDVKLADFGSAGRPGVGRSDRRTAAVTAPGAGTLLYQAPEVKAGRSPTPAADLYAVGLIAHEALVGQLPVRPQSLQPTPPAVQGPQHWQEMIERALKDDPRDRFRSAGSMRSALREMSVLPRQRGPRIQRTAGDTGWKTMQ